MKNIRIEAQDSQGKGQWQQWGNVNDLEENMLNQMNDLDERAKECLPSTPADLKVRNTTASNIHLHFKAKHTPGKPLVKIYHLIRYPLLAAASFSLFFMFILNQENGANDGSHKMSPTFADTVHSLHQSLNPQEDSLKDQLMLKVN